MQQRFRSRDQENTEQVLTRLQRRVLDAGQTIRLEETDQMHFQHSVLCHTGFPRKQTMFRVFERQTGHMSILLEAGKLFDGYGFVDRPLPYGSVPRLIMMYVSTQAIRTKNRRVEVGYCMRQFLKELGLPTSGGARGGYTVLRKQMEALAACRLTFGMSEYGRAVTVDAKPIRRFEAWIHRDEAQRTLWPEMLELSKSYFNTLCEHAVPLDARALAAIRHSSLAMDIYTWLAHRLCRVRAVGGVKLSWWNLREQFGQEYRSAKDFKKAFKVSLRQVLVVYPHAKISDVVGGLMIYPSRPPMSRR